MKKIKRSWTVDPKNNEKINIEEKINPIEDKTFYYYHREEDILTKYNTKL